MKVHTGASRVAAFVAALSLLVSCQGERLATRSTPDRLNVPLQVDVPAGIRSGFWPVTLGVPFPEGVLSSDSVVTVTLNGEPVPTQTAPLATWRKDGKHVRWLLVDFQANAGRTASTEYRLVAKPGKKPVTSSPSLRFHREGNVLKVDTGAAEFVVRDRGGFRIESVRINGRELVKPERPIRFIIANDKGKTFEASGDLSPQGAIVEDQGLLRLGIKSEGWYRAADGSPFCQHVTRLEFFAGSPTVKVLHTFVYTETSESAQIRDLGLEIPLGTEFATRATFGIDGNDRDRSLQVEQPDEAYLVQDNLNRFNLKWDLIDGKTGKTLSTGEKAGGWVNLSGNEGGATVALREAWQNYPNEFEIKDGKIITHLWPLHGRLLDFRTKAVLAPYGEKGIEVIDKFFLNRPKPYSKSIFDVYNNAMGLAKTHELLIDFHEGPAELQRMVDVATQANTPVLAITDPRWNCASGALGPLHPQDKTAFLEVEEMLDAMFDRYVYWRDHYMDFGWFDYQDVHCDARGDEYSHEVEGGRIAHLWRYWDSTHYGFPKAPWVLYFRSGDRKYLEFAEANARHCMDIDRCHYGDDTNRIKGTHYYCDWSIIHWGGHPPEYVMLADYTKLEYLLYAYYMRGYRRGLDVMKEYGEAMARFRDDETREFPLRMLRPNFENIRHFGPALGNMTELYRVTWDDRYLDIARDYAEALVQMLPGPDFGKHKGRFWDWMRDEVKQKSSDPNYLAASDKLRFTWEGMANYADLTGDPRLIEAMLRYAQAQSSTGGDPSFGDVAYGYQYGRDPMFLDRGKARLMQTLAAIHTGDDAGARGSGGYWVAGGHPYSLRTIPIYLAAVASAPENWKQSHLPLIGKNRSFHMAGPRLSTLHVQPTGRGVPHVRLRLHQDQVSVLTGPDGSEVERQDAAGKRVIEFVIGPEHLRETKVHQLSFPLRPTRKADDYIERGNVDVVTTENVKLAIAPATDDGWFCVFGPRFWFWVPPGTAEFRITVDTSSTWAMYTWKPVVHVFGPDDRSVGTKTGPGRFEFVVTPTPGQTGKLWSLGPIARVSAPTPNNTWNKPIRPVDSPFPAWFKLSENLPQFVSAHPDQFFMPQDAPSR